MSYINRLLEDSKDGPNISRKCCSQSLLFQRCLIAPLILIIKAIPLSWNCTSLTALVASRVSDSGDDALVGKRTYKSVIWEKAVVGKKEGRKSLWSFLYDPLLPLYCHVWIRLSNCQNSNLLESVDSYFPRKYLALFEHRKCEEYRLRVSQSIVPSERGFNLVRYRVLRVVCWDSISD